MKKRNLYSLMIALGIFYSEGCQASDITENNEPEKIIHRAEVGFGDPIIFKIQSINCAPIVKIECWDDQAKLMDISGKSVPSLKTAPINSFNPTDLMLVPDMKAEDNLLGRNFSASSFPPVASSFFDNGGYCKSTSNYALWVPQEERFKIDGGFKNSRFLKITVSENDNVYSNWISFQNILNGNIMIEKVAEDIISIYTSH